MSCAALSPLRRTPSASAALSPARRTHRPSARAAHPPARRPRAQGNSIAGKRAGNDDPRSGLIFRVLEIIKEATPSIVLLENTPTALRSSMRLILEQLSQDYDVAWGLIGASHVGYPHKCVARAASHGFWPGARARAAAPQQEGALLLPVRPPACTCVRRAGRVPGRLREARDQAAG